MKVVIENPKSVLIDNIQIGNVVDAIANMPQFAPLFQTALEESWEREVAPVKVSPDTRLAANLDK